MRQYTAADAAAKYEAYRRAGHPLTPEQVVDELVADYAGRHLREEGAIRRLAGKTGRWRNGCGEASAPWQRGSVKSWGVRSRRWSMRSASGTGRSALRSSMLPSRTPPSPFPARKPPPATPSAKRLTVPTAGTILEKMLDIY